MVSIYLYYFFICLFFFNSLSMFVLFGLDIDVNFHKLDEYSSSLLKKSQQQSTKKDSFSSVS